MIKYILTGVIIAVMVILWVIYGDFLMTYIGKKVPEVNFDGQNHISAIFSPERVKNEFTKETKEIGNELGSAGNIVIEKIKSVSFLATVVKSIFWR